ncbi:hypothetical protein OJF2_25440 [Aquisphaera giovannonii]|uniref:Uncharacterized protein n=1 Tax=Aquisphaera giovannonii TaxID=406548 RepID=A0A5B9W1D7_9BACT|nr:hypothetical protein [Aquisphaera giovannonii]QEH34011.1 hypothetical protein OJF2_25440 [Aquisphaera giovannonii]
MATEAQILANRRNAQLSTGPRTAQGKAAVRFNALKHGGRSRKTTMPALPGEDPRELERHVRDFVESGKPGSDAERELLERAARLSWTLERFDRAESAHLARAVRESRKAVRPREPASSARIARLGRELFAWERGDAAHADAPAVLLAGLEQSPEGRAWLLEQWAGFRNQVAGGVPFTAFDRYRFLRLLGKDPMDALTCLRANAIFRAWNALGPGAEGEAFFALARERARVGDPIFLESLAWRALGPLPPTAKAARAFLLNVIEEQSGRLRALQADDERSIDADDCAAFDAGPQLAQHRRVGNAHGRELLRILDALRKLRKAGTAADEPSRADETGKIREIAPSMPTDGMTLPSTPQELMPASRERPRDDQSRSDEAPGTRTCGLAGMEGDRPGPSRIGGEADRATPGTGAYREATIPANPPGDRDAESRECAPSMPSPARLFPPAHPGVRTPGRGARRDDRSRWEAGSGTAAARGRRPADLLDDPSPSRDGGPIVAFSVVPAATARDRMTVPPGPGPESGRPGGEACRPRRRRDNVPGRNRRS